MNEFTLKSAALTLLLNNHIELVASNPRTRNIYVAGSENFTAIPNLSEFYIPLRKVMESLSLTVKTSEPDGDDVSIRGVRVIDDIGVEDITITEEVSGSMEIPQYIIGQLETPYGVTKINDEYITTWEALVKKVRAKFLMTDIDAVCSICAAAIYVDSKKTEVGTQEVEETEQRIIPSELFIYDRYGEHVLATSKFGEHVSINHSDYVVDENWLTTKDGVAPAICNMYHEDLLMVQALLNGHTHPCIVLVLHPDVYDQLPANKQTLNNVAYITLV